MIHRLPRLDYKYDALAPHMSEETLKFHYGKHHQTYVDNLNKLIKGTDFETMSLEEIIQKSDGVIFNNAAQIQNHNLFWKSLTPNGNRDINEVFENAINEAFGSFENMIEQLTAAAIGNFGSGWTWLVKNEDATLSIESTSNADTPCKEGKKTPILTIDVWEHTYYIDHRNARPAYLEAFWKIANWEHANTLYMG